MRLPPASGPEPAPDCWLPVSRRHQTVPGVRERALQQRSPEERVRGPQQQLAELQAQAQALRLAGAAGRERVWGPAVWRPEWLLPLAVGVQARAPEWAL